MSVPGEIIELLDLIRLCDGGEVAGEGYRLLMGALFRSHLEGVKPLVAAGSIVAGGTLNLACLFFLHYCEGLLSFRIHLVSAPVVQRVGIHVKEPAILLCPRPTSHPGAIALQHWTIGTILTFSSLLAGAMLESHPAEGETPAFKGSMMLALASDEAEVRAILENDIYAHSGVWDLSKAQIIPVRSIALRCLSSQSGISFYELLLCFHLECSVVGGWTGHVDLRENSLRLMLTYFVGVV